MTPDTEQAPAAHGGLPLADAHNTESSIDHTTVRIPRDEYEALRFDAARWRALAPNPAYDPFSFSSLQRRRAEAAWAWPCSVADCRAVLSLPHKASPDDTVLCPTHARDCE